MALIKISSGKVSSLFVSAFREHEVHSADAACRGYYRCSTVHISAFDCVLILLLVDQQHRLPGSVRLLVLANRYWQLSIARIGTCALRAPRRMKLLTGVFGANPRK
eukprot:896407-Amphidinium_carterae.1